MALFGSPNIEELTKKKDIRGLVKALGYKKDPDIRQAAVDALISLWKPVIVSKSNTDEIYKWLEKIAESKNQNMLDAHEKIFRALFPQFYSDAPKSRMRQEMEERQGK